MGLGWNFIQAKNFVGVIRLPSGFQLEILPKIDGDESKLRGLVVEMLRTLKDFSHKKFRDAAIDTARFNLYEIFIRIYLEMVFDLIKRGLRSSYVTREENLNVFKGKLLVNRHVRKNFSDRFTVKTQVKEKFLFDTTNDYALKPDILLTGDEPIVLDTKWKFAPTEADMYQMFAYAKRYGAKKIFLLCPPTIDEKIYRAEDFSVAIFGVDLFDMNAAMSRLLNKLF